MAYQSIPYFINIILIMIMLHDCDVFTCQLFFYSWFSRCFFLNFAAKTKKKFMYSCDVLVNTALTKQIIDNSSSKYNLRIKNDKLILLCC